MNNYNETSNNVLRGKPLITLRHQRLMQDEPNKDMRA
jgi:hypothetical protein